MKPLLAVLFVCLTGCSLQRSLRPPADVAVAVGHPFSLGALSTSMQVRSASGPPPWFDTAAFRQQLEQRLSATLAKGATAGAPWRLDLELDLDEEHGVGPGMAAGLATEAGVLTAGGVAGALIGTLIAPGLGTSAGGLLGVLAASPPALVSALAFDTLGVSAEYRATLRLRRQADHALVATRRVVVPWRVSYSSLGGGDRLSAATSEAVGALEAKALEALAAELAELASPPAPEPGH